MDIVMHRVNTIEQLERTPHTLGVEIDLRTFGTRLILNHEPKQDGPLFSEWLTHYRHGLLILNPKEEGLEDEVRALVRARGIESYFFLDLTMAAAVKLTKKGERRVAARFSEYESVESCRRLAPLLDWVWVDSFTRVPLDDESYAALKATGLKLCLCSPEMVGHGPSSLEEAKRLLRRYPLDAVCTDEPEAWSSERPRPSQ